ncbi:3-oxoacyl-[acyl-carrier protein] reductase [Parafrankia irregularis]|uniref:3-oxoacyl-[acyl-carrier protein] reductase n=1 Tax=Parafrankia irregularis TaxID=795642 RepID=A0A0S4QR72_9ACTN|nr:MULTISPECIES: SDR family NAD(P)-dependent oxidoreductase [Parafrankia]MBE3206138.1 SDR family oxidoreductase [Parafrankia sp. CH37]CUU57647.1 3-oxoacyl-[acyl-carrier protein] reductase [Parafrankia irregularis]
MSFTIDLSGRTAVVTGGGQGVGRAACLTLAAAGARVLVNDFVADRAESVAKEIEQAGGAAAAVPFDVSDYQAVTRSVSDAGVDILVNNAGNAGPAIGDATAPASGGRGPSVSLGEFTNTEPADWERYFAVNLYGVMNCTRATLPHMIAAGHGRIITIVSDAGRVGEPHMAPYAAAKAGAAGFTRAIAREVGRDGITVNNIALATVDTIGLAEMAAGSPEIQRRVERQLRRYIVPRLGQPDDVAGLVTFLASPAASWITGQTYPVNGGYSVNL